MLVFLTRKLLLQAVAVLLFASAEQAAFAQDAHHRVEIFAEGGASFSNQLTRTQVTSITVQPPSFPTFTETISKTSLRTTGRFFGGVRFWLDKNQAVEASYSYAPADVLITFACTPNCGSGNAFAPVRAHFVAGNYVHMLPGLFHLRPFLTSGIGFADFRSPFGGTISRSHFTANFGGGFDFKLTKHWTARAEYRDWIFNMPGGGVSGITHNSVPSVGVAYRF